MVVHSSARFPNQVKRVVFVGGDDSMLLHEILKCKSLELVICLEIDQTVTRNIMMMLGMRSSERMKREEVSSEIDMTLSDNLYHQEQSEHGLVNRNFTDLLVRDNAIIHRNVSIGSCGMFGRCIYQHNCN